MKCNKKKPKSMKEVKPKAKAKASTKKTKASVAAKKAAKTRYLVDELLM